MSISNSFLRTVLGLGLGVLGTACLAQSASVASKAAAVPMCTMGQLSVGTDQENGSFDGMSHGGTLLVLRNIGSTACRVGAVPQVSFTDGKTDLGAKGVMTGFMPPHAGHGPVLLPVVVAAGAEVTSKLRWVSGEVYGDSVCISPTAIVVTVGGQMQQAAFTTQMCGERAKGIQFEMGRFRVDPVWTGK